MRYFIFLITLLALVSCQPAEQAGEEAAPEAAAEEAAAEADPMDPTVSYADHYKVEFENDQVRVVRATYAAEEEVGMHSHPDQVVIFLADGSYAAVKDDGTEEERSGKAGDAAWAPAETHSGKALTAIDGILVEIKGGGEAEAAPEEPSGESTDSTEVAPDHYKAELENDHVRVVRITYAAGEESGNHSHPAGLVVGLSDWEAAFVLEDGSSEERSGKVGMARWAPAETHAAKALSDIQALLVEIK
jgi:quercetin dioxygenase-like cupin family protein